MKPNKPPWPVMLVAILYIAIGAIGFVYHLPAFHGQYGFHQEDFWIELTEAIALISGVFLLLGRNWARWLALAWIAFHVLLSAFHSLQEVIIHSVLCAIIAFLLFCPPAMRFFRGRRNPTP
jgi:phosphatidylglycerophosphate synthase